MLLSIMLRYLSIMPLRIEENFNEKLKHQALKIMKISSNFTMNFY